MNVADSANLTEVLQSAGYLPASSEQEADILLVNTCVVRQGAEDRAAWYVTSSKGLKEQNPELKIILCGCYVTEPGRDVKKQFPHVDLFIPPHSAEKLRAYLGITQNIAPRTEKIMNNFVTIMTGCDNYCAYCVVPYVRGKESSRSLEAVLEEIGQVADRGARKIILLGQNVNSYQYGLANLLHQIDHKLVPKYPDLQISFLTNHPKDLTDEIIEAMARLPFVEKEIQLPLQSGDNDILKQMNRGYTYEYYVERVNKLRTLMPEIRIFTDLIVGFPGESEAQFSNTLKAVTELNFREVHMFAYSPRPETAAAQLSGQLDEQIKQARLQRLIKTVRELVARQ